MNIDKFIGTMVPVLAQFESYSIIKSADYVMIQTSDNNHGCKMPLGVIRNNINPVADCRKKLGLEQ
jgi:hypothetical protein